MTTRTVRLVGRSQPGISLGITQVTIGTGKAAPVPIGIKWRAMGEGIWQPLVHPVAGVTLPACNEMTRWLAGCGRTIMATVTGTRRRCVIKNNRGPVIR